MAIKWHFNQPSPGDKNREPVLSEFFATDAIRNAAEALIREGIQNAMDAGLKGQRVQVRIYVSGDEGSISGDVANAYFEGGWQHFHADGNGLISPPEFGSQCRFLTFEDFGTTGLDGDPAQYYDRAETKNPFYYFFRAEGQTAKEGQERGRWGVGKTVFPRASNLSSYYGLTVRQSDGQRMLMGQSVLKYHFADNSYYSPDGYWGIPAQNGLIMPTTDQVVIDKFAKDFRLSRKTETGLSIVVPYSDREITEKTVLAAVCKDYFYPILAAKLDVRVESPTSNKFIDAESIREIAVEIEDQLPSGFLEILDLAEGATTLPPSEIVKVGIESPPFPPRWSRDMLSNEQAAEIQRQMELGERVALRIYLKMREKNQTPVTTYFDVFFIRNITGEVQSGRPVFVREGIIISDVRSPATRGVLALVIVEDKPLATLLGDSENPAHTQWQRESSHFKGKYVHPGYYIPYVSRSVHEILRIIAADENKTDPSLLIDFFSLALQQSGRAKANEPVITPDGEESVIKPDVEVPHSPPRFRVDRKPDGFSIRRGSQETEPPQFLAVRVAYDTRRGSPVKKYRPIDFEIQELVRETDGVVIQRVSGNELLVEIMEPDFELSVQGFDTLRDLYIDVKAREVDDDTSI